MSTAEEEGPADNLHKRERDANLIDTLSAMRSFHALGANDSKFHVSARESSASDSSIGRPKKDHLAVVTALYPLTMQSSITVIP